MTTPAAPVPSRPRLVLRLGFAGRRELSDSESRILDDALDLVLARLGRSLAELAPGVPVRAGKELPITSYYSRECPALRIVTGLCEGADDRAAEALARVTIEPDEPPAVDSQILCLTTELGAVLPFSPEVYRGSRSPEFLARFDERLAQCAWVVALDGIYDKPAVETPLSKERRARAYRAQSAVLLRQSDILIAAANPDDPGRAGGTMETVREALAFDLPVVFIHTGKATAGEAIHLVEPEDLLANVLAGPVTPEEGRDRRLNEWVVQLTADPDAGATSLTHQAEEARKHGEAVLTEYFDKPDSPAKDQVRCLTRLRTWAWDRFERRFKTGPKPPSDPPLGHYALHRKRATTLNYHYSALYRGAFLLNYVLAILAVILAAISLTLLGTAAHTPLVNEAATLLEKAGLAAHETAVSSRAAVWLVPVLIVLGVGKILLLSFISQNTTKANKLRWNDRAIDTRYLAERLRGMFYLPRSASQQPPAAAPPQFASRAVRQSAVDWLFDAIVRSVSPADLEAARTVEIPAHDGAGTVAIRRLFSPDPRGTLQAVRDAWIGGQIIYHSGNTRAMRAMHHGLEALQKWLGRIVIVIVACDLALLGMKAFHWPEALLPFAKLATPWLIAASAILPAIVAALSGIRFQSECQALAERSDVMRALLAGKPDGGGGGRLAQAGHLAGLVETATADPDTDPGSWTHDALRFTERIATDFVQEAAEWSVLYAKDVSDPG